MIETVLRVFDAMQIRSDAERQWHRVSLWLATLILLRSRYLLLVGLAAKASWAVARRPFVALAVGFSAACRATA